MAKVAFETIRGVQAVTMWRAFTLDGEKLTPTERAVSNLLALHYSSKTGHAYPSREKLADHLGLTVRSVTRAIRGLREKGIWGVIVGRGGIYKGTGTSASSHYYPSAHLIQRNIETMRNEEARDKLRKTMEVFTVLVDVLDEDVLLPQLTPVEDLVEPDDPKAVKENKKAKKNKQVLEEDKSPFWGEPTPPLTGKYAQVPVALAAALTKEEADSFLGCSKEAQEAALRKVEEVVSSKGVTTLAVALRGALAVAKIHPVKHKEGWAGWISTFGLERIPKNVNPLYSSMSELKGFTSLLEETTGVKRSS